MLFFRNDYGQGCIQDILDLLQKINLENVTGYGMDPYCTKAKQMIQSYIPDLEVDIHFLVGGTITNQTIIKHILKPFEAVLACDSGHVSTHETGSIEATGHKVIMLPNNNGKLTPEVIKKCFNEHMLTYEHMVYPKLVYISNATEFGTVYTKKELMELRNICDELGLYLMMDGARLGQALTSNVCDYDLNDIAKWCDVFYIGGTKNGALMGEAVVITNPSLKPYFRFNMKQNGAMMAKGWLLGVQFIGLFTNDNYFTCGKHANKMSKMIQDELVSLKYPLFMKSDTNQVFPVVSEKQFQYLSQDIDFEVWDKREDMLIIRFVTSWCTKQEDVDILIQKLQEASALE
ncbi:threonine aldolase family protein [Floccifex sp.]|uniref:threonine aldolase family protein n=1 Tax=Floccifex sp. TaxID=2815810 RepID=UPI003F0E8AF6